MLQGLGTVFTIVLVQISLQFFNEANQDLDNLMTLLKAKDPFERKIDISSQNFPVYLANKMVRPDSS